ncbi:autotransporter outer membrane beta-barrel domain-containing protein [Bartonella taylorii]|uniref:autotransporter outer membrane beta-barrel domain-containing protein n=2 Tax=Bartonella taylorii TaxID=33046 RepID=UPI001ABBB658|nr:autotransporter outer membrane beta-barrel domain-containing protein [Bartonella taylorii]
MNKIFKNHLSLCVFTTVVLFFVPNVDAQVQASAVNDKAQNGENNFSCNGNGSFYRCNDGKSHDISNKTYQKTDENNAEEGAIEASGEGTRILGKSITIKGASNSGSLDKGSWKYGVVASNKGKVLIKTGEINSTNGVGAQANNYGTVSIEDGAINFTNGVGVQANNRGMVYIRNGAINFTNGVGVQAKNLGIVSLYQVFLTQKGDQATNVNNNSENWAFQISGYEDYISLEKNSVKVSDAHGVSLSGIAGRISVSDSTVLVEGNRSYGIQLFDKQERQYSQFDIPEKNYNKSNAYNYFGSERFFGDLPKGDVLKRGDISLNDTSFMVPNSVAIYSKKSGGLFRVHGKSTLSGDLLLKVEDGSFVKVSVDRASTLVGGVRIDESSDAEFQLKRGSKWTLTRPKNKNLQDSDSIGDSSISFIHLIGSSIVFEKPNSSEIGSYQTLRIGKGSDTVYTAERDSHIYLNTYLNEGGAIENQRTDRVLIHGNVSGQTTVHVHAISGSPGGATGSGGNDQGISIIQVSGEAKAYSFRLNGGYVTLNNSPYQYRLRAYGQGSDLGEANSSQRLVGGDGKFWDFRLESQFVKSADSRPTTLLSSSGVKLVSSSEIESVSHSGRAVRSVVPQVPTYLLLPNSIFHAGLMDISNQNKQLEILRTTSSGMLEVHENPALYLRGYGGRYSYASDLSAREYGYGGNLNYNGVEAGILSKTIENAASVISLGVMGSYGKLFLKPLKVKKSQESVFDKWTGTAYGSMQHDSGFYVDGLFSYGFLKGDVLTSARGKTATLKGNPLSVSLTGGQTFATGYEGFVFDPQVQVVYQHLQFSKARDVDNFDIEMGKLEQWVARVGGRLVKIPREFEGMNSLAFYGKLYFSHGFGERQSVRFKDTFQLGGFGSSLEVGLGFNARLSGNFLLQADMIYQHKLTKAGFSGASFSGGVRYSF